MMVTSETLEHRASLRRSSDARLLSKLRERNEAAYTEFIARFRPILEAYARKVRIPRWEWDTCIGEVLADEMMRFSRRDVDPPVNLAAYLIRAVYNRYLRLKRASDCRERHQIAASSGIRGEWIVASVCSESALRCSDGPDRAPESRSEPLARLVDDLGGVISDEERVILIWLSQGIAHREIAEWLGTGYEATTKRIWRLCRRLRADAIRRAQGYAARDRTEVERFIRRAG